MSERVWWIKAAGKIAALALLTAALAILGQPAALNDELLDKMAGEWVLQGTIAGQVTTHDITAQWVLEHEYLQLHEVSREKDAKGRAAYEAIVTIGWDPPSSQYACLWLDTTGGGGLNAQAIGYARRQGSQIPFLFKSPDGSLFHTTFFYDAKTDTWEWRMDAEEKGQMKPFARVKLTRKTKAGR